VPLPESGWSRDQILDALTALRGQDARWQDGKTFGMVYDGGAEVHAVVEDVSRLFLHENALNTNAFPSLARIQSDVVRITADLLHGDDGVSGFMTSGGTESILCAVKAARERGGEERGITEPEMVVPASAHAAFHKAAHYFGIRVHKVPVRDDWRADVDAMAAHVGPRTVLVVGSAPQYPQGVIDPIPELAALAADVGASFHTDACMGGFFLPFVEALGEPVPPWDFRVEGVTTISADLHKLGYAPKGASVVLHRTKALRRYQTFVFDDWLGGFYASPALQGSRPAAPMATAWATLHSLGHDGYVRLASATMDARRRMVAGVRAVDGLTVLGAPEAQCLAITVADGFDDVLDVFAVGDALLARGWHLDRQKPPDSLHATVSAGNVEVIDDFLGDLAASVAEVGGTRLEDRSTSYATLE
jgi:glutamate/tyrosine decarboxylase-like PLP-dependent enzyme